MTFEPLPGVQTEDGWEAWVTADQVKSADSTIDDAVAAWAAQWAGDQLYDLTGRRFGVVQYGLRPWLDRCCGGCAGYRPAKPLLNSARWPDTSASCARFGRSCGCAKHRSLLRVRGPVVQVSNVWIDGVDVAGGVVSSDDGRHLEFVDPTTTWPCGNDMNRDPTVVGEGDVEAWEVIYWAGRPIPETGKQAALILAVDVARANPGGCGVPNGVVQIQRQGVTVAVRNGDELVTATGGLLTDNALVNQWIMSKNRHGLRQTPRAIRADDPRRHTMWRSRRVEVE